MALRQTRVLVVDDDEQFAYFVATLLETSGYDVAAARSAAEAIALARELRPDAAVVDVVIPGRGGYSICRELREELGDQLPVIFVSGERTDAVDRTAGILIGGDDYLVKPIHPEELLARLERLLDRRRASGHGLDLSARETEILQLIAEGWRPVEIARQLHIAPKTVSSHVEHIFGKLGVHTRAQAVAVAYEAGAIRVSRRLADEAAFEAHVLELA